MGPAFTILWSQVAVCRVGSHLSLFSLPIQASSRPGRVGKRLPAERQHQVQRAPSSLGPHVPESAFATCLAQVSVEHGAWSERGGRDLLVVQWLGSVLSLPRAQVQSLVGVQRSHTLCGVYKKKRWRGFRDGERSAISSALSSETHVHPHLLMGAA